MTSLSEAIQTFIAGILRIFKPKRTLADLSWDELLKEKRLLETNEKKILKEVARLEEEKSRLFEQALKTDSKPTQLALAGKIRNIDQRVKGLSETLAPIGKHIHILDRLIAQKEMGQLATGNSTVIDIIRNTDSGELQAEIENQLAEDSVQGEKLTELIEGFATGREQDEATFQDDEEILGIMQQIENAKAAEAVVAAAEETEFLEESTNQQSTGEQHEGLVAN